MTCSRILATPRPLRRPVSMRLASRGQWSRTIAAAAMAATAASAQSDVTIPAHARTFQPPSVHVDAHQLRALAPSRHPTTTRR